MLPFSNICEDVGAETEREKKMDAGGTKQKQNINHNHSN